MISVNKKSGFFKKERVGKALALRHYCAEEHKVNLRGVHGSGSPAAAIDAQFLS